MADIFLTWEEAQGELLPHVCVCCAEPATEWADWQICHAQARLLSVLYTYVDVTLPVCPRHRSLSWNPFHRIVARKIESDGVILSRVSPGFVEAVWDNRDSRDGRAASEPYVSPQPSAADPRPRPAFSELDAAEFDDFDDFTSRRYAPQRSRPQPATGWSIAKIVLIVLAFIFLAPCALVMFFTCLALLFSLTIG